MTHPMASTHPPKTAVQWGTPSSIRLLFSHLFLPTKNFANRDVLCVEYACCRCLYSIWRLLMRKPMSTGRKAKNNFYPEPPRSVRSGRAGSVRGGGGLPARNTDMFYSDMLKRAAGRMNQPGFQFPQPAKYNSPEQLQRLRDMMDVTRGAMRGPRALPAGGGGGRGGGGSTAKVGGAGGASNRMTKDQPIVRRRSAVNPGDRRMTNVNPEGNRMIESSRGERRMTDVRPSAGRGRADVVPRTAGASRTAGRSLAQTGASLAGAAKSLARTPAGAAALRGGRNVGLAALGAAGTAYTLGELLGPAYSGAAGARMGRRSNDQSMAAGDVSYRRVSGSGKSIDVNRKVGRSALGSVRNSGRGSALNLALGYGVDVAGRVGGRGAGKKSQAEVKAAMMKSSKFRALNAADQRKVATAFDQWAVGQDRFNPARTAARRRPSDAMRPSAGRSSRLSAGYM